MLRSLPKDLQLSFVYQDKPINMDKSGVITLNGNNLETEDGIITLNKEGSEVLKPLTKWTTLFTYLPPGKLDGMLKVLSDEELMILDKTGEVDTGEVIIKKSRSYLKIDETVIYNLIPYSKKWLGNEEGETSLDDIRKLLNKMIVARPFPLYNLSSPAAEARALMCSDEQILDEFFIAKSFGYKKLDVLDTANMACYGGRMESAGLGTSWQANYDMIKAHMRLLSQYPGLRDMKLLRGKTSANAFDSALGISLFYIKTLIQPGRFKFNPLPVHSESGIKYPSGEIKGWYYKPYLEMLDRLKIKYTIMDSLIFAGKGSYPFKNHMESVAAVIKAGEAMWPDLEFKHLYATLTGSTKAIYKSLDKNKGQENKTGRGFDPFVFGFVLSSQNAEITELAIREDAHSIRIDAAGLQKVKDLGSHFKLKSQGLTTYLTPNFKTMPGGKTLYRDVIQQNRNRPTGEVLINSWNTLSMVTSDNLMGPILRKDLGEREVRKIILKPRYGNREGKTIKRMGELLDNWLSSKPGDGIVENDSVALNTDRIILSDQSNGRVV